MCRSAGHDVEFVAVLDHPVMDLFDPTMATHREGLVMLRCLASPLKPSGRILREHVLSKLDVLRVQFVDLDPRIVDSVEAFLAADASCLTSTLLRRRRMTCILSDTGQDHRDADDSTDAGQTEDDTPPDLLCSRSLLYIDACHIAHVTQYNTGSEVMQSG